jgi:GTP cyclohydrolase I
METINSTTQVMEHRITWLDIQYALSEYDRSLKYYGVPRGGSYLSAMLNPVDTPEEADVIIDDLIDTGATKEKYNKLFPDKPFVGVFNRADFEGKWLSFPWEQKGVIEIEDNVRRILEYFDNANREGLKDTPRRYIKFLKEFLTPTPFNFTTFDAEGTNEMIVQTNIPFHSLCEHHLAPFFGTASIAYVPNGKIVGLSKLARTLDLYSRNFQNQERITKQIAERLMEELQPQGVAVMLKAEHMCMSMRGVKKHDTHTTTSHLTGCFKDDLNCRNEFLHIVNSK